MSTRRALIVDDSKTAQVRLRKMLSRYELEVDIAFSAEEALGMLSYRTPTVIFMDHHMEGMDGFEALKILKANPSTAMIPVIMYTSQKGDVYVGQARALGALDILSKEVIKSSNIEKVLKNLSVYPKGKKPEEKGEQKVEPAEQTKASTAANVRSLPNIETTFATRIERNDAPIEDSNTLDEVRAQIARLFEIHIADVRGQITENTKFVIRRLTGEIEKGTKREVTVDDVPLSVVKAEADAEQSRKGVISNTLMLLILIGLVLMAVQQWQLRDSLQGIGDKFEEISAINQTESELLGYLAESTFAQPQLQKSEVELDNLLLDTLSWALNDSIRFKYGEIPLGEPQARIVGTLIAQLDRTQYRGIISLKVNQGNWCLQKHEQSGLVVAPPDLPISECLFYEDLYTESPFTENFSVSFVTLEQTAPPVVQGDIELDVLSQGFDYPIKEYPNKNSPVTAKEWNQSAMVNSRISIGFMQE